MKTLCRITQLLCIWHHGTSENKRFLNKIIMLSILAKWCNNLIPLIIKIHFNVMIRLFIQHEVYVSIYMISPFLTSLEIKKSISEKFQCCWTQKFVPINLSLAHIQYKSCTKKYFVVCKHNFYYIQMFFIFIVAIYSLLPLENIVVLRWM